jgi:hypothetical protein
LGLYCGLVEEAAHEEKKNIAVAGRVHLAKNPGTSSGGSGLAKW